MDTKKFITDTNLQRFGTNVKTSISGVKTTAENALTIANSKLSSVKTINGASIVGTGNLSLADIGIDGDLCIIVSKLPLIGTAKSNKIYLVPISSSTDTNNVYAEYVKASNGTTDTWEKLGEWKADITIDTAMSDDSTNPVQNKVVKAALDDKVDKESGKVLSTNDYTTTEKTKLAGIEEGANKTVVDEDLDDTFTSTNPVQNKAVATKCSSLGHRIDGVVTDLTTITADYVKSTDFTDLSDDDIDTLWANA